MTPEDWTGSWNVMARVEQIKSVSCQHLFYSAEHWQVCLCGYQDVCVLCRKHSCLCEFIHGCANLFMPVKISTCLYEFIHACVNSYMPAVDKLKLLQYMCLYFWLDSRLVYTLKCTKILGFNVIMFENNFRDMTTMSVFILIFFSL